MECGSFSTRGGGLTAHTKNSGRHPNCGETCPGNRFLLDQNNSSRAESTCIPTRSRAESEVAIPERIPATKLRILLVLPPDFDKPTRMSEDKVYDVQVPFQRLTPETQEAYNDSFPGFLDASYRSRGMLQTHAMVRHATQSLVQGLSVVERSC
jgi:hypothetical protein